MNLMLYQIDAFANRCFEGNPAAICPLQRWLPDTLMQAIATENNLSETAFFVPSDRGFHIRWFTPVDEVDLCGHATLASAYLLFNRLGYNKDVILFDSKSGLLTVTQLENGWLAMDFPVQSPEECETPQAIITAFGKAPVICMKAEDYLVIFENEQDVLDAAPNMLELSKLDLRGVCISAPGSEHDIVTRFFAPKYGINEDPVTGSAYTQLIPYWAERLGKTSIAARQCSSRGGDVRCELKGERVVIAGQAVMYLEGSIEISDA